MKNGSATFLIAILAIAAPAHAQVLRAHGANSGLASDGAGVFMNLSSIGTDDLSITGFDFHTWTPGNNIDVTIYTRSGGFSGFTADPGAWINHGTTTVTRTNGLAQSNYVDTPNFAVNVGSLTGVYFFIETNGIGYSTSSHGSFRGPLINDGRLMLEAGVSRNELFGGQQFGLPSAGSYRGFAGNVYYKAIPAPAGAIVLGLAGLALTRRRR